MSDLVSALITKGVLNQDSMLTTRLVNTLHCQQEYHLQSIVPNDSGFILRLKQSHSAQQITVSTSDVIAIDGMSVLRYAEIFNINPDGTSRTAGRKRGRKPKIRHKP